MARRCFGCVLVLCGALAGTAVYAHHSFAAQYDSNQQVTLKGTITKVEWMNPHAYFYVDVADDKGKVVNWAVEGGAPNVLYREGWKPTSLKAGDKVTIPARARKTARTRSTRRRSSCLTAAACSRARRDPAALALRTAPWDDDDEVQECARCEGCVVR